MRKFLLLSSAQVKCFLQVKSFKDQIQLQFRIFSYSRVPNKRGGVRITGELEVARYNDNRGLGTIGGGGWRN